MRTPHAPTTGGRVRSTEHRPLFTLIIIAAALTWLIASAAARPMICRVWSFARDDYKNTLCIQRPRVKQRARTSTPKPAATESWPTATPTTWIPWMTETTQPTPYILPEETGVPYP